ncbi:MAG TPA: glycogen debranching enzyme N-terminal domain-containing protein [Candidatus Eisenbacteria bacterium]|jgi:hypothetical protein
MRSGQDVLADLRSALATEWVIAHGTGGSSSGTACGANARRAHALLTAAGPHGRLTTLLLKLDERLRAGGALHELGCNPLAGGGARPAGHLLLESFALDPWPCWTWRAGEAVLEKRLLPISGHDAIAVRYRLLEGPPVTLAVSPWVVARDPSAVQRESPDLGAAAEGVPGRVRIQLSPDRPALALWHNGTLIPARVWQHGLIHPLDGTEETEDALVPGHIEAPLTAGSELHVVAAAEPDLFRALAREDRLGAPPPRTLAECVRIVERAERAQHEERTRQALAAAAVTARQAAGARAAPVPAAEAAQDGAAHEPAPAGNGGATGPNAAGGGDTWTGRLAALVLSGLARRRRGLTLVGSLPSATDGVVETLRAVPALLALRAFDAARAILAGAAEAVHEGLAPEGFDPDDGRPRYGDPAPALWLVHAAELYARRSDDLEFVRHALYEPIESVVQAYRSGTRWGIRTDADGLLAAGEPGEKRADLNALWYHALVAMGQLAKRTERKEAAAFFLAWAREHQTSFNEMLWDEKRGALYDAIVDGEPVRGISPGQLLAVRIAPPVLLPERFPRLLATLERELFTPLGLRARPSATRAETAWLGPFHSAWMRAHGRSAESQARVRVWLEVLRARLDRGSCGAFPEWFEVAPARPKRSRAARGNGEAHAPSGDRSAPAARDAVAAAAAGADAAPPAAGGDPVSVLAAAELLQVWIEELDPVRDPAPALTA